MATKDFILGVSGFRGRIGIAFEPATLLRFALAFAALVRECGGRHVVVGRDTRPSGSMASHVVAAGLLASGLDVTDVGIAPTPTVLHATAAYDADGSMTITASHNPADWNGMEFSLSKGILLSADDRERLRALFDRAAPALDAWDVRGSFSARRDAIELHLERILRHPAVDREALGARRLRVVIDACNGAGSVISPQLLDRLGCRVIPLFCEPTGLFPRSPEPTGESLNALRDAVLRERADIGFAHDPDADRLVIVDERGVVLPEEYTFAFVADVLLRRDRRPLVTTVVTGGLLDEVAAAHSVPVIRTPVGVGHVVAKMREIGAAVGGESTGGVIVRDIHPTTDGIAATALIASALASDGRAVSDWVAQWNRYHLLRAKVPLSASREIPPLLTAAAHLYPDAAVERMDGVKFRWPEGWLVIRPSGTEPVLRVFAESTDRDWAERRLRATLERIGHLV